MTSAVVALAASALVAAVARAVAPEFHVESAPATLTGSIAGGTENYFKFGELKMVCTSETDTGTMSTIASTTLTTTPTYSGCKASGSVEFEANWEGCEYVSHLESGSSPPSGTVDLKCAAGKQPTFQQKGKSCMVQMEPNQNGMPKLTLKATTGPPADIDRILTVTGLNWTAKGCLATLFIADGTYKTGEIVHDETIKADKQGGGAESIWVE